MVTFQEAYDAVAARYSDEALVSVDPKRLVNEIYQELRHLDAEAVVPKVHTRPMHRAARARLHTLASPLGDHSPERVRAGRVENLRPAFYRQSGESLTPAF